MYLLKYRIHKRPRNRWSFQPAEINNFKYTPLCSVATSLKVRTGSIFYLSKGESSGSLINCSLRLLASPFLNKRPFILYFTVS